VKELPRDVSVVEKEDLGLTVELSGPAADGVYWFRFE
jgi:hypothetical protein